MEIFGQIQPPAVIARYPGGIVTLLSNIVKLLIVVAGLYFLLNLISAGYQFISAGGNPKAIESAWARIWQSLVGLIVIAGSFVLAAIFGYLIFGDATAILKPKIYGP